MNQEQKPLWKIAIEAGYASETTGYILSEESEKRWEVGIDAVLTELKKRQIEAKQPPTVTIEGVEYEEMPYGTEIQDGDKWFREGHDLVPAGQDQIRNKEKHSNEFWKLLRPIKQKEKPSPPEAMEAGSKEDLMGYIKGCSILIDGSPSGTLAVKINVMKRTLEAASQQVASLERDKAQLKQENDILLAAFGIGTHEKVVLDQRPVHGSVLIDRGSSRIRTSPTTDEAIKLEQQVVQLTEEKETLDQRVWRLAEEKEALKDDLEEAYKRRDRVEPELATLRSSPWHPVSDTPYELRVILGGGKEPMAEGDFEFRHKDRTHWMLKPPLPQEPKEEKDKFAEWFFSKDTDIGVKSTPAQGIARAAWNAALASLEEKKPLGS